MLLVKTLFGGELWPEHWGSGGAVLALFDPPPPFFSLLNSLSFDLYLTDIERISELGCVSSN